MKKKKTDEFANLTSQLKKKQQEKKSTWKPEKENTIKTPKTKKEAKTPSSIRLTILNFSKLKEQAYLQDRSQADIANDALTVYFMACEKWKGQGHEAVLDNLLKALKNK